MAFCPTFYGYSHVENGLWLGLGLGLDWLVWM